MQVDIILIVSFMGTFVNRLSKSNEANIPSHLLLFRTSMNLLVDFREYVHGIY